jgi:PAS domain S-box-containing protein
MITEINPLLLSDAFASGKLASAVRDLSFLGNPAKRGAFSRSRSYMRSPGILSDPIEPSPSLHGDPPAAATPQGRADRNALAAVAVERTRMPMVMTDARQPDYPIVLANTAFLELTGYASEEVLGRNCRFLQGEETSPAAVAEIRRALAEERELDVEILNYRKDGTTFWNQLNLSPVHDDEGRLLYVFGSQIDVTELRKVQDLEASEHRLLLEVDHRARNVLAVVNGIVRMSRADDAARYAASIQQRVNTLSDAHSLLADRGWQDVPLEEIVRQQINGLASPRVRLEGPEVLVPATAVQPLALVIHELAKNASQHGSLSAEGGRLDVRWAPGPDRGSFTLEWEETVSESHASVDAGVGAMMIKGMIEHQLRGAVEQRWTPDGLFVALSLPGA